MQVSEIVQKIIPKYRGRVKRILNSGKVSWDSQGRVLHNDKPIDGSDVGRLVHGVVTDNKRLKDLAKKQPGWGVITKVIKKSSFRRSLPKQVGKVKGDPRVGSLIDEPDLIDLTTANDTKDYDQSELGAVGGQEDPLTGIQQLWNDDYY